MTPPVARLGAIGLPVLGLLGAVALAVLPVLSGRLAGRFVAVRRARGDVPGWVPPAAGSSVLAGWVIVLSSAGSERLPFPLVLPALLLAWLLAVAAAVDLATRRIPSVLTATGGVVLSVGCVGIALTVEGVDLRDVLFGALVPPLVLELLARSTAVITGTRGVGRGDVRLVVSIGPVLATIDRAALLILAVGTVLAALPAALHARVRDGRRASIALAPPLALASLVALGGGRPLAAAVARVLGADAGG